MSYFWFFFVVFLCVILIKVVLSSPLALQNSVFTSKYFFATGVDFSLLYFILGICLKLKSNEPLKGRVVAYLMHELLHGHTLCQWDNSPAVLDQSLITVHCIVASEAHRDNLLIRNNGSL